MGAALAVLGAVLIAVSISSLTWFRDSGYQFVGVESTVDFSNVGTTSDISTMGNIADTYFGSGFVWLFVVVTAALAAFAVLGTRRHWPIAVCVCAAVSILYTAMAAVRATEKATQLGFTAQWREGPIVTILGFALMAYGGVAAYVGKRRHAWPAA